MKKLLQPTTIFITLLVLIAAFLRLYRIADYLTFLGDEGRDVLVVYNILHGHFTLLGPTSSVGGFFLGPIYYYFMAPFLWAFNYNPVGPAIMIALFGTLTVWLVYQLGSAFFNKTTGIIAATFYTIAPVVIAYSRSSWNPNLMPITTLLTLLTLYKAVTFSEKKNLHRHFQWLSFANNSNFLFLLCGFLFGILLQLHYLAVFVGAIMIVYLFAMQMFFSPVNSFKNRLWELIKYYAYILGGFVIGFSPYIAFEARHGFPNTMSILAFIFHSKEIHATGNFFLTIYDVFFRLFGRLVTSFPPPSQVSLQAHPEVGVWYALTLILGILSSGYFFIKVYSSWKTKSENFPKLFLIFCWFVLGILLFGLYNKQIYDYYFEFIFPIPFLLVGFFLSFLFSKNMFFKIITGIIIVAIIVINLLGIPFRYEPNRQLNQMETISKVVDQQTGGKPYNFALITGGNSDHAYRYFLTIWGHPPTTIENPVVDPQRTSVTSQLLVVCETVPCQPLGASLWEVAGFGRADIVGKWHVSVVDVYRLVHYTGK